MRATSIAFLIGAMILIAGCEKQPDTVSINPPAPAPPKGNVSVVPAPEPAPISASTSETPAAQPQSQSPIGTSVTPPAPQQAAPITADTFATEASRILSLPTGRDRDAALETFTRDSMQSGGFERTREWITKLPQGATRDTANAAFIRDLARVSPGLALDYAREISDPKVRAALEASIRSSAPTGPQPENP